MEDRKPAAERIRPILEAMERSIDSARRKRTLGDEPAVPQQAKAQPNNTPSNSNGAATPQRSIGSPSPNPIGSVPERTPMLKTDPDDPLRTEDGGRLKARPKRPQNYYSAQPQALPPYHSRAS